MASIPRPQQFPTDIQLKSIGLSTKASRIYRSAFALGQSTVLSLSTHSGIKRTTIYYILDELIDAGALFPIREGKKIYYQAEDPRKLLEEVREALTETDNEQNADIAIYAHSKFKKPRIYFLEGLHGFKKIWDMVFKSKNSTYRIITNGESFLDFVKEKYIIDHIISTKRQRGVQSKQIIVDSAYARSIVAKDKTENRQSRFLPTTCKLSFTEIITETFTAFISARRDNTLFVVENEEFSRTRQVIFDDMWERLSRNHTTAARQIRP